MSKPGRLLEQKEVSQALSPLGHLNWPSVRAVCFLPAELISDRQVQKSNLEVMFGGSVVNLALAWMLLRETNILQTIIGPIRFADPRHQEH